MTKMFINPFTGKRLQVWNPLKGCMHGCYNRGCWANRMALRMQKMGVAKYMDGFKPSAIPVDMSAKFKPDDFVFVCSMGDLMGYWNSKENIAQVVNYTGKFPETKFLLQTKNPERFTYPEIAILIPFNCYLGTTIETNRDYKVSFAPRPELRYLSIARPSLRRWRRFISIEPIMDFDLDTMLSWMQIINPSIVEIGADNYKCGLPEPSWDKVEALLKGLRDICPVVIEKEGLERLKQ